MDVENPITKGLDERRTQKPHEAGQTDQIDALLLQNSDHLTIERFPAHTFRADAKNIKPAFACPLQARCRFHVTDNDCNLGPEVARRRSAGRWLQNSNLGQKAGYQSVSWFVNHSPFAGSNFTDDIDRLLATS